jgi:hypothetical protein
VHYTLKKIFRKITKLFIDYTFKILEISNAIIYNCLFNKEIDIKQLRIAFFILSYERPEYLEVCLRSLYKSEIGNTNITFYICDDGSKSQKVKELIDLPSPKNFVVKRIFFTKGKNFAGSAINRSINYILKDNEYNLIGWADSDCLFHPLWLKQTLNISIWAKNNHKYNIIGPFTSFNSSDNNFHKVFGTFESPFGKYVVKRQAGMLNYFLFVDEWHKYGPFNESDNDETLFTKKLSNHLIRNISTETSYIEHIGQNSTLDINRDVPLARSVFGLNLEKNGWTKDILDHKSLGFYKSIYKNETFGNLNHSSLELDIFIPCAIKDIDTLQLCIDGLKKNLLHPINNIYVVSPYSKRLINFCQRNNILFLDENKILEFDKNRINYYYNGKDKNRWIYQQLLKFHFDTISTTENFLVIDADTILINPQKYEDNNKFLLLLSDEYNLPYFNFFVNITKINFKSNFSSVSHSMLFNKGYLNDLKMHIEKINNNNWIDSIIENIDRSVESGFSEFELYGLWVLYNYPNSIIQEYFFNKSLRFLIFKNLTSLSKRYPLLRSVSFHKYLRLI